MSWASSINRWGVAFAEVIADLRVVPEQLTGPHQQVVKLGPTLGATFGRVFQDQLSKVLEDGHQHGAAGVCDLLVSPPVQIAEQVLQDGTGVPGVYGVIVPVSLTTTTLPERKYAQQKPVTVCRPGLGSGQETE